MLCAGSQYAADIATTQDRGDPVRFGSAYVDARTGAMGVQFTVADADLPGPPGLGNGFFAAAFDEAFRINGPAPATPVIVSLQFSATGNISGACSSCAGSISFMYGLDGVDFSGFQSQVAAQVVCAPAPD